MTSDEKERKGKKGNHVGARFIAPIEWLVFINIIHDSESRGDEAMPSSRLAELERTIDQLSCDEQLWLIERLVHRLRDSMLQEQSFMENQLVAMASDPEIQNELHKIASAK